MGFQITSITDGLNLTKLSFNSSLTIEFCNLGAAITGIFFSNKFNIVENIVLMPETLERWLSERSFSGAIIGPLAGRYEIGSTDLEQNRPPLHVHGGSFGMDKWLWEQDVQTFSDRIVLTFSKKTADLEAKVVYTLTHDNRLIMEISGCSQQDTFFNPTNHVYFNLNGDTSAPITNHQLFINSDTICLENSQKLIIGEQKLPETGLLNFSKKKALDEIPTFGGLDTTFLFKHEHLGSIEQPLNGRKVTVSSTLPAAVIFTFNAPQPAFTKNELPVPAFSGITFETQFPANQLDRVKLTPQKPYYARTTYQFSIANQ